MKRSTLCLLMLLLLLNADLPAEVPPSPESGTSACDYAALQARVAAFIAREKTAHRFDTNWLVRPGVVASSTGHTAWVYARATGLKRSDPVEFTLITTNSGRDYEALVTSFGSAVDIADAMRFIGLPDGQPVNHEQPRFWPKGERVRMTVERYDGNNPTGRIVRTDALEKLLFDTRAGRTLPSSGWVYIGPNRTPDPTSDRVVCAADVAGPQAIGALYNECYALFDVPRLALQGELYGSIVPNPDALLEPGTLVRVQIQPEYADGRSRVRNLSLIVTPTTNAPGGPEALSFELRTAEHNATTVITNGGRKAILATFGRLTESGHDPFVSVTFDNALTVTNAQAAAAWLESIEGEHGVRIEPPPPDGLFYRSLIPPDRLRRRTDRPQQPLELHLRLKDVLTDVSLTTIEEYWKEGASQAELTVTSAPVANPAALAKALAARPQPSVLLIFTDPAVTIQQLRPYLAAARPTHPTVHIYTGQSQ
ncbi:MAG: hypothetical protein WCL16_09315 [bacterium]